MALWGVIFTVLMALPAVSVAQMTVSVTSLVSSQSGNVKVESGYKSLFSGAGGANSLRTEYLASVAGFGGGPTTVQTEFENKSSTEIGFAGLTILKLGSNTSNTLTAPVAPALSSLRAVEKIGTGYEKGTDSFGAAGGSEISVTQTMHETSTSTLGGTLVYLMQSEGVGTAKAGVAGEFKRPCVECQENYKAGFNDTRLQGLIVSQMTENAQTLKSGFQISEWHIEVGGPYSAVFQGAIQGPTK
jgi:hypothetical protein